MRDSSKSTMIRGWYGDFKTIESRALSYTTRKNIHQTLPKRQRSSPGSKVHPRSAPAKAVPNVHIDASRHHDGTHALTLACKLSSASKAPVQSSLTQRTAPEWYSPMACASPSCIALPTPSAAHSTRVHARQPKSPRKATPAAPGITCARSASHRSVRTVWGGSRGARRHDRYQDLRGLSNARRQHLVVLGLMSRSPSRS